jgi:uridine kinase
MVSDVLHIMSEMSVLSTSSAPPTARRRTGLRPARAAGLPGRLAAEAGGPADAGALTAAVRRRQAGQPADAGALTAAVRRWQAGQPADAGLLVVAIDGPGASGKSTIARAIAAALPVALVHTDDFFLPRPGSPGALANYYDWRRLRAEALEPLRAGRGAAFRRFDWTRGVLGDTTTVAPGDAIVLEGVFSAAPQLSDLVHRAVFVDTARPERLRRLRRQIAPEDWDDDWLAAEQAYFAGTRPPESFDLVVPGTGRGRAG